MPNRNKKPPITYEPISIIMPVLNNLEYTKACIDSINKTVNKSLTPYEFIIIDNASTDDSPNYLREFASQNDNVRIITQNKNIGVAPAWNLGIREAKYDYVCVINNDIEFFSTNWLIEMQTVLKGSDRVVWTSPRTCYTHDLNKISYKTSHYEQLLYGSDNTRYVVACCFMCPKRIFDRNILGEFDEGFEVKYYEDLDYIARILSGGYKVNMCSRVLIYHGVGKTSRITVGGANNENYYQQKWGGTKFDILAMQPGRKNKK